MKPLTPLVRVAHGSHLYGTSTPTSDHDFKGVHLPSGAAILLQRAENHVKNDVVSKVGAKNDADAIDDESFSLQKFYEMLSKGDTVATEILFAPVPADADPRWLHVQQIGKRLINRQCKGFVGYCIRQAAKYGIKGSRMAAVESIVHRLEVLRLGKIKTAKLSSIEAELHNWSTPFIVEGHVSWENIPSPNGTDLWHLNVCDRKMPMTATIEAALDVWKKVWENYGARARAARDNDGIDWKAVSHAVRVAEQAIELLRTGKITFPRPNADVLLAIKQGECQYKDVSALLEMLVARVQECSESSQLPNGSDHKLIDRTVSEYYARQLEI